MNLFYTVMNIPRLLAEWMATGRYLLFLAWGVAIGLTGLAVVLRKRKPRILFLDPLLGAVWAAALYAVANFRHARGDQQLAFVYFTLVRAVSYGAPLGLAVMAARMSRYLATHKHTVALPKSHNPSGIAGRDEMHKVASPASRAALGLLAAVAAAGIIAVAWLTIAINAPESGVTLFLLEWAVTLSLTGIAVAFYERKPRIFALCPLLGIAWVATLFTMTRWEAGDSRNGNHALLLVIGLAHGVFWGLPLGVGLWVALWARYRLRRGTPFQFSLRGLFRIMAVVAAVCGLVVALTKQSVRPRAAVQSQVVDARMVADAERIVREKLARLGPDSEIYRRYGKFQCLQGGGFDRPHYAWQLVERVAFRRRAVFAKGAADVGIGIFENGPLAIASMNQFPAEDWLLKNPQSKIVKRGGELWIDSGGGSARSSIEIAVSHPNFRLRDGRSTRRPEPPPASSVRQATETSAPTPTRDARHPSAGSPAGGPSEKKERPLPSVAGTPSTGGPASDEVQLYATATPVTAIAYSPDGRELASGDWNGTVRFWDLASRQQRLLLKRHSNAVWSVVYVDDGRIRLWKTPDQWDRANSAITPK